jgi:AcrR family transcriptional regulator
VARQTVYAHYASRDRLLGAILEHVTAATVAVFERLDLDGLPAPAALSRWVEASWRILEQYPVLLTGAVAQPAADEVDRHRPITGRLAAVLERGRAGGQFDASAPVTWQIAGIVALGHAAAQEVAAGRMAPDAAGEAFRSAALRVCLSATDPG